MIFKRHFFNLYISWSPYFGLFFRTPNFKSAAFFLAHICPSIETCSDALYEYTKHIKPKFRSENVGFCRNETFKRHPVSSVILRYGPYYTLLKHFTTLFHGLLQQKIIVMSFMCIHVYICNLYIYVCRVYNIYFIYLPRYIQYNIPYGYNKI